MEDRVEQLRDPSKRNLDRNRGLQMTTFAEALKRAGEPDENTKTTNNEKKD